MNFKDLNITIMGLGLHGGGLSSALFFAKAGAKVTVTDLRSKEILSSSIEALSEYPIKYTLGEHKDDDFKNADIVIKNPAVPSSSKYLKMAKRIETDISIFLSLCREPVIAITGSKGKSTTASAVHFTLKYFYPDAKLGGNITVSPLNFIDTEGKILNKETDTISPIVLELSSWQLADLKTSNDFSPEISLITNIMNDHQNYYNNLDDYAYDKSLIFSGQKENQYTILNFDDQFCDYFSEKCHSKKLYFSNNPLPKGVNGAWLNFQRGFLRIDNKTHKILNKRLALPGEHNRQNLLCAALILTAFGLDRKKVKDILSSFKGIKHRMEYIGNSYGLTFYNDSAATIPEACKSAIESFDKPIHLITGGTDKNLDFSILSDTYNIPKALYILEGSASEKIIRILEDKNIPYNGPYSSLKKAFDKSVANAEKNSIVMLSPGCASFGMFLNEFDRGDQFRSLAEEYINRK